MLEDYKGDAADRARGEAFDPSPANIEARTTRAKLAQRHEARPAPEEDARRDRRRAHDAAVRRREEPDATGPTAADLAADMLMRGTRSTRASRSRTSFDRLKARVSASTAARRRRTSSSRRRARTFAAVLAPRRGDPPRAHVSRRRVRAAPAGEPRRDRAAEERARRRSRETSYQRHMSPYPKGDVRYVETPDESLAELQGRRRSTDARKFYGDFYGASNAELAIVGDFDPKEARRLAAELFGDWKSPRAFARVPQPYQDVAAGQPGPPDPRQGERLLHRRPEPRAPGRRSGLSRPRARQLHAGRRVPELAPGDAASGRRRGSPTASARSSPRARSTTPARS